MSRQISPNAVYIVAVILAIVLVALLSGKIADRHCQVEYLVEVVSPNGEKVAAQQLLYCNDGVEEHRLSVEPRYSQVGESRHSYPYVRRNGTEGVNVSAVPRLRIWWTDDANIHVEYPNTVVLVESLQLGDVNVQTKPSP